VQEKDVDHAGYKAVMLNGEAYSPTISWKLSKLLKLREFEGNDPVLII
jgi:hypothetical protein